MRYIEGFRNPGAAAALTADIAELGERLEPGGRQANIMEVCGSHTMAIARYGIRDLLPAGVSLISGPGCPVCVTPPGYIDAAIQLAKQGCVVVTFGDMINVPGSDSSLAECRASGGRVEIAYSPSAVLERAQAEPGTPFVFLAIGFETTIAPVVSLVASSLRRGIENVSLLTAFKLVPPALKALLTDPDVRIDAFLCPAHVSAIIGAEAYAPFSGADGVPCVVAGFEPLDILLGLRAIIAQLADGASRVENLYERVVRPGGNRKAQELMDTYLEPADAEWRGIGMIPESGLALRPTYHEFDAAQRFGVRVEAGRSNPGCICGEVIKGKCLPPSCALFGTACTPDHAVGPCMVSSEGTCSAYFKYSRL